MSLKLFDKCEKLTAGMHKRRCGTEQRMSVDHLHRIVREDDDPKEVSLRMIENNAAGAHMALVEQRPSFDIALEQTKRLQPEPVEIRPVKVKETSAPKRKQCGKASAAGQRPATEVHVVRRQSRADGVVACMVEPRDRERRKATRTR